MLYIDLISRPPPKAIQFRKAKPAVDAPVRAAIANRGQRPYGLEHTATLRSELWSKDETFTLSAYYHSQGGSGAVRTGTAEARGAMVAVPAAVGTLCAARIGAAKARGAMVIVPGCERALVRRATPAPAGVSERVASAGVRACCRVLSRYRCSARGTERMGWPCCTNRWFIGLCTERTCLL